MNIEKTKLNHAIFGFFAVNFLSLGVSLFLRVNIGFAAFDTFIITVQELFNFPSYGNTSFFIQLFFCTYLIIFRKKMNLIFFDIGISFIGIFLITRFIDGYIYLLAMVSQVHLPDLVVFTLGLLFLSFGIYLFSVINSITPPMDKFLVSYSIFRKTTYSNIKLALDGSMAAAALAMIFLFELNVPVNGYTIFLTFAPGYVIKFFEHVINFKLYLPEDFAKLKAQK